jgi:hypothetical protein
VVKGGVGVGAVMLGYHKTEHEPIWVVMGAEQWVQRGNNDVVNPARICGPVLGVHRDVEVQVEIQTRVLQTGIGGGGGGASAAVHGGGGRFGSDGDTSRMRGDRARRPRSPHNKNPPGSPADAAVVFCRRGDLEHRAKTRVDG